MNPIDRPKQLEQTLADWRGQAAVLRHNGHSQQAETIERVCDSVKDAATDYLEWMSETAASLQSGRAAAWLRQRFPLWEAQGHARHRGRHREYRKIVVPQRFELAAAKAEGDRLGKMSA